MPGHQVHDQIKGKKQVLEHLRIMPSHQVHDQIKGKKQIFRAFAHNAKPSGT
jgi:hypothetical protein